MLGRWGRALVTGDVIEYGSHFLQHAVSLSQTAPLFERYPCALVFAIATLDLLVHALLHLALEDAGSRRLVIVGYLEDVRSVDPVVGTAAHDMVAVDIALVDGDLRRVSAGGGRRVGGHSMVHGSAEGTLSGLAAAGRNAHYCMSPNRSCHLAPGAFSPFNEAQVASRRRVK